MISTILTTKLHKPLLADNVISRTDLLKDSDRASVILVSAQAGSGKSTLVSAWLSEQCRPHCWYSLDEWDNDLTQFLAYLTVGINAINKQASAQLQQMLDAFQSIGLEGFLKGLVHQLHAIELPFILVLDDYQVIQNNQIHQVFRTLIEHMPKWMQLVLITREDPPLPLAKLRASKRLLEIRISDLKFGDDEVRCFFLQQLNLTLQEEQLQLICKRTEGWIAGLQLTALSMRGIDDKSSFIDAFAGSHYYIMDYLIEEVLENQTPEIKDFLLKTAVLDFFSGALCDAVVSLIPGTGRGIIHQLVKTNSFIIPMEGSREWYRYHHLFRDLLRQRLEQLPKEDIRMLHHHAGLWFQAEGRDQEAIQHLLKAEAFEEAAALIECRWASMDLQLQSASWLEMARRLPASILERSPVLTMGYGWATLDMGDMEGGIIWLEKAQSLYDAAQARETRRDFLSSDDVHTKESRNDFLISDKVQSKESRKDFLISDTVQYALLPATIASAYGYIAAAKGDMAGVFRHSREALAHTPNNQYQKRSVITMLLAIAHWGTGELHAAETFIAQSIESASHADSLLTYNSFFLVLGELHIQQGYLDKACDVFEHTIARVIRENQVPVLLASLYLGLAKVVYLRGESQQAFALLEDSKGYGQKYALMDWNYKYYLLLARVYCSEGFLDLAKDCLRESRIHYFMNPIPDDITFEEMDSAVEQAEKRQHSGTTSQEKKSNNNNNSNSNIINNKSNSSNNSNKAFLQEHANQSLPEPLTVRELEVITFIASGASNREICCALFLALSTVKGYNQAIFQKLQVKRRTEAVIKAKALGLV